MISIEKLHGYLSKGQDESDKVVKKFVFKIPESKMSDDHIYGKYVLDGKFVFLGKEVLPVPVWTELDSSYQLLVDKTAVKMNSFIVAILNQVMNEFRYFESKSRVSFVRDMMRQIAIDMEEKNLYREMEYTRVRNDIRANFMNAEDIDGNEIMKKIFVDYLSLTVYVLRKDSQDKFGRQRIIERYAYVPGVWKRTEREGEYIIKNPTCFLVELEGKYYSVIRSDLRGLFSWQDEGMEVLFEQFSEESLKTVKKKVVKKLEVKVEEPVIKEVKLEKLEEPVIDLGEPREDTVESEKVGIKIPKKITLAEIQEMAVKEGILITKRSEKTGKDLKKSILELREEIMKKYE